MAAKKVLGVHSKLVGTIQDNNGARLPGPDRSYEGAALSHLRMVREGPDGKDMTFVRKQSTSSKNKQMNLHAIRAWTSFLNGLFREVSIHSTWSWINAVFIRSSFRLNWKFLKNGFQR
jgi:hypothetical protein